MPKKDSDGYFPYFTFFDFVLHQSSMREHDDAVDHSPSKTLATWAEVTCRDRRGASCVGGGMGREGCSGPVEHYDRHPGEGRDDVI